MPANDRDAAMQRVGRHHSESKNSFRASLCKFLFLCLFLIHGFWVVSSQCGPQYCGPYNRIWSNCPNVGNYRGSGLQTCEELCNRNSRCNAINANPTGGCVLRACSSHQAPTWDYSVGGTWYGMSTYPNPGIPSAPANIVATVSQLPSTVLQK